MFTDWSSEGSPRDRNNQCVPSARNVAPRRTEIATREPEEEQAIRHVLSEVLTTPSVQGQTDQVGTRFVDRVLCRAVRSRELKFSLFSLKLSRGKLLLL